MCQAVAKAPDYENHLAVARLADKHHQFDLAIAHYQACLSFQPSPELYHNLAQIFEEQGQTAKAMQLRSRSVSLRLPDIRGRKFKNPVTVNSKSRNELKAFFGPRTR